MTPKPNEERTTQFTLADRKAINETAKITKEIFDCLFGNTANPTSGLFHIVNLNTRFRQNMTKLMWVLIPIIISMVFTLIMMNIKP